MAREGLDPKCGIGEGDAVVKVCGTNQESTLLVYMSCVLGVGTFDPGSDIAGADAEGSRRLGVESTALPVYKFSAPHFSRLDSMPDAAIAGELAPAEVGINADNGTFTVELPFANKLVVVVSIMEVGARVDIGSARLKLGKEDTKLAVLPAFDWRFVFTSSSVPTKVDAAGVTDGILTVQV